MFDLIWRLILISAVVLVAAIAVYATSWPVLVWLLIYVLAAISILRIYLGFFARRRQ